MVISVLAPNDCSAKFGWTRIVYAIEPNSDGGRIFCWLSVKLLTENLPNFSFCKCGSMISISANVFTSRHRAPVYTIYRKSRCPVDTAQSYIADACMQGWSCLTKSESVELKTSNQPKSLHKFHRGCLHYYHRQPSFWLYEVYKQLT